MMKAKADQIFNANETPAAGLNPKGIILTDSDYFN
jgi:hypothetical protein